MKKAIYLSLIFALLAPPLLFLVRAADELEEARRAYEEAQRKFINGEVSLSEMVKARHAYDQLAARAWNKKPDAPATAEKKEMDQQLEEKLRVAQLVVTVDHDLQKINKRLAQAKGLKIIEARRALGAAHRALVAAKNQLDEEALAIFEKEGIRGLNQLIREYEKARPPSINSDVENKIEAEKARRGAIEAGRAAKGSWERFQENLEKGAKRGRR